MSLSARPRPAGVATDPPRAVVIPAALFPNGVATTEQVGLAMLAVARSGYPMAVLETRNIDGL